MSISGSNTQKAAWYDDAPIATVTAPVQIQKPALTTSSKIRNIATIAWFPVAFYLSPYILENPSWVGGVVLAFIIAAAAVLMVYPTFRWYVRKSYKLDEAEAYMKVAMMEKRGSVNAARVRMSLPVSRDFAEQPVPPGQWR